MKRKINIDRPQLSSKEIASRQDFSSLIKQLPKVTKPPFYKTGWFITTVASIAGIAVITTNFILNDKTSTPNQELAEITNTETPPPSDPSDNLISTVNHSNEGDDQMEFTFANNTEILATNNTPEDEVSSSTETTSIAQNEQQLKAYEDEVLNAKMAYEEAVNIRLAFEKNKPTEPITQGNPDRQFVLDVNPKDFPELALYKNLLFEVEANDPNFSPSVYEQEWEDIQLKTKETGKTYYLSLYRGDVSKTFSVFPVYQGVNYETALTKYNQKLSQYNLELKQRQEEEQKLKTLYEQKLSKLEDLKNQETNLSKTN